MRQRFSMSLQVHHRAKMLANRQALLDLLTGSSEPLLRPDSYWGPCVGWVPFRTARRSFHRNWKQDVFSITLARRRHPRWTLLFISSTDLSVHLHFYASLLARLGGSRPLVHFLTRLHELLGATYGYIHDYEDNWLMRGGDRAPSHFCDDPPELGICGVRWVNLFGREYVALLGEERLRTCPAAAIERLPDGAYLVVTDERPPRRGESQENPRYRALRAHLGEGIFADGASNRPARLLPHVDKDEWPLEKSIRIERP